jgi:uncharacterized protein YyaL (SSP411 family)
MREAVKSRLMEKMYKKLREGKQKLTRDNEQNLTYLSGMMMETDAEQETCSRKTRSITMARSDAHIVIKTLTSNAPVDYVRRIKKS